MNNQPNLTFLSNSDFGKLINVVNTFFDAKLISWLESYNQGFITYEEPIKSLLLKAYGFSGIETFISDSPKFFNALLNLPLYEAFIDILVACFNSTEITIDEQQDGIAINVVNKNDNLLKFYIDSNTDYYVDSNNNFYKGFGVSEFSSVEWFFTNLLKRFVTAGIHIKSVGVSLDKMLLDRLNQEGIPLNKENILQKMFNRLINKNITKKIRNK